MGRNNRWRLGSAAQSHEQRCDRQQNSDRSEFFRELPALRYPNTGRQKRVVPVELLQRFQTNRRPPERFRPRSIQTIGVSRPRHYDAGATLDNKGESSIAFI